MSGCSVGSRLALLLALVASQARAEMHDEDEKPAAVPNVVAHRPSGLPDRVILGFSGGDPSRTQAVSWRTDASVLESLAQIAPAADDASFVETARGVRATTTPFESDLGLANYHSVVFEDLVPGADYLYRVGDGTNWSEWFRFRTASDGPEPFSFIYFGDAQNEIKAHWSRVVREAFSTAPRTRFLLHAGDLVNQAENDAQWGEWFRAGGWVNAMVPTLATPGNHEYAKRADETRSLTANWRPQFVLPENGPPGFEETVYSIDFQGVRFISLNSNDRQGEQVAWLEERLKSNPNRWTIVAFHHPIYSAARSRDNAELRALWQPLLDKYRVDLVLQGHDHTYARSGLMTGDVNVSEGTGAQSGGTVYVVSVSGPKMYDLDREEWMKRAGEDTQLFQVVSIDGLELTYQARTARGILYDSFTLKKREGAVNELIEGKTATPERLRPEPPPEAKAAGGAGD